MRKTGRCWAALTRIFVETVSAFYAERSGDAAAKTGAVTVVQRTSSDLKLNPHLHVVLLDGAYVERGGVLVFRGLGHLQTREVGQGSRARGATYRALPAPAGPARRHW